MMPVVALLPQHCSFGKEEWLSQFKYWKRPTRSYVHISVLIQYSSVAQTAPALLLNYYKTTKPALFLDHLVEEAVTPLSSAFLFRLGPFLAFFFSD